MKTKLPTRRDRSTSKSKTGPAAGFAIKHILVPVDFSERSLKAKRYAVAFARQFGASVSLIHVVGVNYGGGEFAALDLAPMENELAEAAARQLKEIIEKQIPTAVPADAIVRIGRPVESIVDSARQRHADLIIMSTHGHTGLKHMLLGSVTENVVRHAACPVLVVREHEQEFVTE